MRISLVCFILVAIFTGGAAVAKDEYVEVIVTDPYLEMHTGPASGYPIFHVVERGEQVTILKRKTDWFKIRTSKNVEGWVFLNEMKQTKTLDGLPINLSDPTLAAFLKRDWEMGLMTGDFEGAVSATVFANYYPVRTLSLELSATQAIGNFSSSIMGNVRLMAHPFPEWRASPFFGLGMGYIKTSPDSTLVRSVDRDDPVANVTVGANIYISKRFVFRIEYNNYKVFTSRNDNEEVEEWKAGIAAFF
jgi:hypothetical protein